MTPEPPDRNAWAANMVALYCALLESRTHFAQAVYGDGEWKNILGTGRGTNAQGEAYAPELGNALRRTLLEPVGQWCVLWPGKAGAATRVAVDAWIQEHRPPVQWLPFRPLSWASVLGLASPFFRMLRGLPNQRIILVGPQHMEHLDSRAFTPTSHVEVPPRTAWLSVDHTCESIEGALEDDAVVLFAAGQASNLMIHRLWAVHERRVTLLDVGSMLDPYCGIMSRRVHRDVTWQTNVMPRNVA